MHPKVCRINGRRTGLLALKIVMRKNLCHCGICAFRGAAALPLRHLEHTTSWRLRAMGGGKRTAASDWIVIERMRGMCIGADEMVQDAAQTKSLSRESRRA
jgi:hypothetical protein